jgi:hypothetical protein
MLGYGDNIYDFLHFLSLIKIRPIMDFGGGFSICTYIPQYIFIFFLFQREWRRLTNKDQTKS